MALEVLDVATSTDRYHNTLGLKLAWALGFKNIEVEGDCLLLVNLLQRKHNEDGEDILFNYLRKICHRSWTVARSYIVIGVNGTTDALAKL
ncbi:hypothetical protein J1N35_005377 [Gossypium stocksii]|uniref:RNase H type-1 domain-containing protein n=1 Tax=Gossypium stocksii TaxID=47602 RepID=A0A9D3WDQ1_9ROSI|nr:hypothetical protein J1N35_005377 [Gossypium stocksii]